MLAVPRDRDGPDLAALDELAEAHWPTLYFTQSAMQNPTGASIDAHKAFRLLQIAEKHNFLTVEDDIFSDLQAKPGTRLAGLDQLSRVIYVRSSRRLCRAACGSDLSRPRRASCRSLPTSRC